MDCFTHLVHVVCCKFLVGGPVLIAVGIYLLVLGNHNDRQRQIAQLNGYSQAWTENDEFGYAGFKREQAFVRMSIIQEEGDTHICSQSVVGLAYDTDLQGGPLPADNLAEYPSWLQTWEQWKMTAAFPPANAQASAAFVQGCALRADFYNGDASLPGLLPLVGSAQSALVTTSTYSAQDLQCGTYTPCTSSGSSSSSAAASSGTSLTLSTMAVRTNGSADVTADRFIHAAASSTSGSSASSCPATPCQSACASRSGAWNAAVGSCSIQTGLRALCLRASPVAGSHPLVYAENDTAPAPSTGPGCFLDAGNYQPDQRGIISPGSANWSVTVTLRSSQDPYLEYLVLTNGGPFAADTRILTVIGAILLSVGALLLGTLLLTICLCCICIRRAMRRSDGQPISYYQGVFCTIAQRYGLPVGVGTAQYGPPAAQYPSQQFPMQQQMVNTEYGYQQPQPGGTYGMQPALLQGYGYAGETMHGANVYQQYPPVYGTTVTGQPVPGQYYAQAHSSYSAEPSAPDYQRQANGPEPPRYP